MGEIRDWGLVRCIAASLAKKDKPSPVSKNLPIRFVSVNALSAANMAPPLINPSLTPLMAPVSALGSSNTPGNSLVIRGAFSP